MAAYRFLTRGCNIIATSTLEDVLGAGDFIRTVAVDRYENPAFFRRLFKRSTGLTAGGYRRMFRPIFDAARVR